MVLPWDAWWGAAAIAVGIVVLMASGARRLRLVRGVEAKGMSLCVLAVVLSSTLAGLSFWMSRDTMDLARTLKEPAPPARLYPDWGAQYSPEDKSRFSEMLASAAFVDWGMRINYFDAERNFRLYQPTDEDRSRRAWRLRYIEQTETSGEMLFWAGLGWILVPWLGLAYAVSRGPC